MGGNALHFCPQQGFYRGSGIFFTDLVPGKKAYAQSAASPKEMSGMAAFRWLLFVCFYQRPRGAACAPTCNSANTLRLRLRTPSDWQIHAWRSSKKSPTSAVLRICPPPPIVFIAPDEETMPPIVVIAPESASYQITQRVAVELGLQDKIRLAPHWPQPFAARSPSS